MWTLQFVCDRFPTLLYICINPELDTAVIGSILDPSMPKLIT
jgi:hypothetical protein